MPDEIEIGIKPRSDAEKDPFCFYINVNHSPFLGMEGRKLFQINHINDSAVIKIKPEKITIHLTDIDIPYRVSGLSTDNKKITITKKE